ncbi:ABC transporter ATP-binding protein [Alteromonas ponticola]|uniref:ABC transporter ATP-binding protein n=1 Tax=Alteromonas ponticola TaxID=2720613 RepID=A0ABX1R0Z0_9ALTE|nr:ABC transporter ATP-binding protein [Alteromonas ponticola]NMH60135.1 ABC transporter ATP-binding protein [Alteromonas ponticola]
MLAVRELSKFYQNKPALDNVSFNLNRGEIVALLGANGSGKTTTVQAICNLIEFEQGDIQFDDVSVKNNTRYLRHVGAVLDGSRNTNWRLTAHQNAEYFAQIKGIKPKHSRPVINKLSSQLGLEPHRHKEVMKLSTGNKQKASLLCALAYQPELMLLDEPTLGLDFSTVNELQQIISEQAANAEQGFLITSHDLSFIDQICDRVIVLEQGKVIFNGSIRELNQQMFRYEMKVVAEREHIARFQETIQLTAQGNWEQHCDENRLVVHYDTVEQVLPLLSWLNNQSWRPQSLQVSELNIEKAYRTLLANKEAS